MSYRLPENKTNTKEMYRRPDRTGMGAGYGNGSRIGKTVVNPRIPGKLDDRGQGSKADFNAPRGKPTSPVYHGKIGGKSTKNGRSGSINHPPFVAGKNRNMNKADIARS